MAKKKQQTKFVMNKVVFKITLVLFFGLLGFNAVGQSMKQRVADRLYDELNFFSAVEMYQDLAEKKNPSIYVLRRTAECYRFLGNSEQSEEWYSKLIESGSKTGTTAKNSEANSVVAEDYYHYAQMLKMNEKYKEANDALSTFNSLAGDNSIAKANLLDQGYVDKLKSNPDRYSIAIMNQKVNTEHSDFGPSYYTVNGETKLIFASARKNMSMLNKDFQWDGSHFLDVYESKLGGDGESTGVNRFSKKVKSKYHEGPISFSNNGTKMFLTRSNYLNKKTGIDSANHINLKLYLSEKDSNGDWSSLKEFPFNSDSYSLGHATVTEDGKTLYFSSDMPGGKGITDIWMSKLEGKTWSKPTNVSSINTEGREMFPYLGKDGILYFSSDGFAGLGGLDLYRATPSGDDFSEPMNMGFPLNTNSDDFALIVNGDETEGYFSSNRKGEGTYGNDDIYRLKINEPFTPPLCAVKGCALDEETEEKLSGVTVNLVNAKDNTIVSTLITKEDGCYEFKDLEEGSYRIEGGKEKYTTTYNHSFTTEDCKGGVIEPANTRLKVRNCGLLGRILDRSTGEPIAGTSVIMKDNKTGDQKSFITNEKGEFTDPLDGYDCPGGDLDYEVTISKDGYLPKSIDYKKIITEPGTLVLEENLFGILKIGAEISELCKIDDILYDFDKSYIRPDAAIELDKLVECMKENTDMIVEIGSHTDCRASKRYNEKLSARRAKAAREYVISKGIEPFRIYGRGYGETRLLNGCACEPTNKSDCSEEEHQLNRRTEFRIVSGGSGVENKSTNSF